MSNYIYDAVAFGAHPDDVEMGMAGTMAALAASGHKLAIVDLTSGEMGTHGTPEQRRDEAAAAAEVLGCDLRILDFEDGGVVADRAGRERIAGIIRELRPRIVFTPYPHTRTSHLDGRANVDHLACGLLVRDGCKLARFKKARVDGEPHDVARVYYYMVPETERATYLVDVSGHRDTIDRSIEAYASQMPIERGSRSILNVLRLYRQSWGMRMHVDMAEAFISEDAVGGPAEILLQI